MPKSVDRRGFLRHATMIGTAVGVFRAYRASAVPTFKTVTPGVLTVAMDGDMPMTSIKDGKLVGTDGGMIDLIGQKLGLSAKPSLMEWSATIESIRSGRADVMLGNMGWTPARAEAMLLTDAIYYTGIFATMKQDVSLKRVTIGDMKGHSIGTVNGFAIVPETKKVPGTTDVKLYDSTDACIRDVVVGRIDFAILDAPTIDYMILQNPEWGLKQVPLVHDAAFPQLTSKQLTVMGLSQQNPDLTDAVNSGVKWLWRTKSNARILRKYGLGNPDYLVPPESNPRTGVDRDANDNPIGPAVHKVKNFSSFFA